MAYLWYMRNSEHRLDTEELSRVAAWSPVIFTANSTGAVVDFLYHKETEKDPNKRSTRRSGVIDGVFGGNESKMSVFVIHEDGTKKSYNVRNILRMSVAE